MKDRYEGQERWLVVVNLIGITRPIRLVREFSDYENRFYWTSTCGNHDVRGKPEKQGGFRQYVFNEKKEAAAFYAGTQAVFAALKDFIGE